jgi:3-oxoacyl-[acyl-carrier protein] reductase
MNLRSKVAIVTGASRGMGLSVSQALAARQVRLALVARHPGRLQAAAELVAAAGSEAIAVPTDICSAQAVEGMVRRALAHYGTIDILINCAFWGPPGSIEQTDEGVWDRTLDTTLKGAFLCTRAVVPTMKQRGGGRIVNIGSLAGKVGEDNRTAYCAAKWGLEGLSAALSVELPKYNIHVHLISPAATDTPWWREVGAALTPQVLERMIPPSAVAEAVCWVLSQPDQVHIPDVPVYNFHNPFEGKGSPFET